MHEDLGMDQYHCGYLLLKHWHLPEGYQTILKEFGSVDYQGENAAIIRLLERLDEVSDLAVKLTGK